MSELNIPSFDPMLRKEQMIGKSCVPPLDTSRNMYTQMCGGGNEYTRKNTFCLSFQDNCFTQAIIFISYLHYPITFLHFFFALSTLVLPFLLVLFLLLFPSALGESAPAFLSRPLFLLPSVLSVCLCHHLCVRNQIKFLLSVDTHMHAVSCPC